MRLFGNERNYIKIGKNNVLDSDLIMYIQMNPFYEDDDDIHKNIYKLRIYLDQAPQYPIVKSFFLTYYEFVEFLYKNPEVTGNPDANILDFIKNLDYDASEELDNNLREKEMANEPEDEIPNDDTPNQIEEKP